MTKQHKIDRVIEYLTCGHLHADGGYEHDHEIIGDTLVVARFDETKENNRTKIDTYPVASLSVWYDEAVKYLRKNHMSVCWPTSDYFGDWAEALEETRANLSTPIHGAC